MNVDFRDSSRCYIQAFGENRAWKGQGSKVSLPVGMQSSGFHPWRRGFLLKT